MARQPENTTAAKSKPSENSGDSALIRELALLLDETNLTEIEIERAGLRVRVARNISIAAAMPSNYAPAAGATVAMPSSLHARKIRSAISPRLAIRILSNILSLQRGEWRIASGE